jgi:hypothetical protein
MVVNQQEILDAIHVNLHALRMQPSYKPSQFEVKVSYLISSLYESKCADCKAVMDSKRIQAEQQMKGNVPQQQGNFLNKIFGGAR